MGDETVTSVKIKNQKTGVISEINTEGVFVYIGYVPNTNRFEDLINLSNHKEIKTDENMQTRNGFSGN